MTPDCSFVCHVCLSACLLCFTVFTHSTLSEWGEIIGLYWITRNPGCCSSVNVFWILSVKPNLTALFCFYAISVSDFPWNNIIVIYELYTLCHIGSGGHDCCKKCSWMEQNGLERELKVDPRDICCMWPNKVQNTNKMEYSGTFTLSQSSLCRPPSLSAVGACST